MGRARRVRMGRTEQAQSLFCLVMLWVAAARVFAQPCDVAVWSAPSVEARFSHALAYDSQRDRMVLFGGTDSVTFFGDTFEWIPGVEAHDGYWSRVATHGPAAREGHAMVYDASRDEVVLFGGSTTGQVFDDTWVWDGTTWQRRKGNGPSGRHSHTMTWDTGREKVVLFGGQGAVGASGVLLGDTWEWDGQAWTLVATNGPSARYGHAGAYDPGRERTIIYGGFAGAGSYPNQTWEWDGATWAPSPAAGAPGGLASHAMVYDHARGEVVLVGGYSSATFQQTNRVYKYNGSRWLLEQTLAAPAPRAGHAVEYDVGRDRVALMGGSLGTRRSSETMFLPGGSNTWQPALTNPVLPADHEAQAVYDRTRDRLVRVIGRTDTPTHTHERRTLTDDGSPPRWERVAVGGPSPRVGFSLVFDSIRHRTVLFGGYDGSGYLSDTWEWDGQAWLLVATTGPAPRIWASAFFDPVNGRVVLVGGFGQAAALNDMWEWDGAAWVRVFVTGPASVPNGSATYDAVRQRGVLWTGASVGQLWEWNPFDRTWRQRPAPPEGWSFVHLAFDEARGVSVLYGDNSYIWSWNGLNWESTTVGSGPLPQASSRRTFVYQPSTRRFLVSFQPSHDDWEIEVTRDLPTIVDQPEDVVVSEGQPAVLSLVAGAGSPQYQWRYRGLALQDDARHRGTQTSTLVIEPALPSDFGVYDCVVSDGCGPVTSRPVALAVTPFAGCRADFNADGFVNSADFFDFIAELFAGCP